MEIINEISIRPRVGAALSYGWSILWDKFITLFLILLMVWVASIPMGVLEATDTHTFIATVFGTFSFLYFLFLYMPISVSADFLYVKAVRKNKLDVREILDVFNVYLNVVLAVLLKVAIVGIGFAFLLIPGVIFACRLAFVSYLVLDKKLDPVKAVEESWRLTRGHGWRIFWMYIVSFFLVLLGIAVLLFGAVIAFMWINATFAAYYQAVLEEQGIYEPDVFDENDVLNEVEIDSTVEEPDTESTQQESDSKE